MKISPLRLTIRILLGLLIVYLGFVAYMVFEPDIANYQSRIEFDSEKWKNWTESEGNMSLRWDMTHDLTKNHKLVGMSLEKVLELLGEPSSQSPNSIMYYLGMARYGIDIGSLILKLENGSIVEFKVRHG